MTVEATDAYWMRYALDLAQQGERHGEVPVGAVVVKAGQALSAAWNQPIGSCDPSAHAEIVALRQAAQNLGNYRLLETTLYVTLEPCAMCAGAMLHARIKRLVFGAYDPKTGAAGSVFSILQSPQVNHRIDVNGGVLATECAQQLQQFFQNKR